MAGNKVEICGVDTSALPVLSHERMQALMQRAHAGDELARRELIQAIFPWKVMRTSVWQKFSHLEPFRSLE